ncbi:hypothetical protein BC834DRAFT_389500 [Gloeopeniophorella convolvens]|nr:hypothetical protein BC834DRAFT_389500 [Gloeopeniophorella convolvens]
MELDVDADADADTDADTDVDTDVDVADAEVGSITTAAQELHSCHVSRPRSVGEQARGAEPEEDTTQSEGGPARRTCARRRSGARYVTLPALLPRAAHMLTVCMSCEPPPALLSLPLHLPPYPPPPKVHVPRSTHQESIYECSNPSNAEPAR